MEDPSSSKVDSSFSHVKNVPKVYMLIPIKLVRVIAKLIYSGSIIVVGVNDSIPETRKHMFSTVSENAHLEIKII